jgi:hypothetical protein
MNAGTIARGLGGVALVAGAVAASYPLWRKACLTWGARSEEADSWWPGDDLLEDPDIVSTRAIDIAAPPRDVWPWLVQMGSHRGGAYTYDWIENLLGLDMRSADEIHPEWQDLQVGDRLPLGDRAPVMVVKVLDPGRSLVIASEDGNWVWAFLVTPTPTGSRLVSRNRIRMPAATGPVLLAYRIVMEPGSLIMERKMLTGIAALAERRLSAPAPASTAPSRPEVPA